MFLVTDFFKPKTAAANPTFRCSGGAIDKSLSFSLFPLFLNAVQQVTTRHKHAGILSYLILFKKAKTKVTVVVRASAAACICRSGCTLKAFHTHIHTHTHTHTHTQTGLALSVLSEKKLKKRAVWFHERGFIVSAQFRAKIKTHKTGGQNPPS